MSRIPRVLVPMNMVVPTAKEQPLLPRGPGRLWCGHPESAAKVDSNGVTYCVECSR